MSNAVASETYTLTDTTLKILKNFSDIAESASLVEGDVQRTTHPAKSLLAIATLDTPWPKQTPIYQLREFLSNVSAYEKPTLTFEETQFVIRGANSPSHVEYPYSDPSVVMAPPSKEFVTSNPKAKFTLPEHAVKEIKKFSGINNLPTIAFEIGKSSVIVKPHDEKNSASRVYSYPVNTKDIETLSGDEFSATIRRELFDLILDGTYHVSVSSWPYIYMEHTTLPIAYLIVRKAQ